MGRWSVGSGWAIQARRRRVGRAAPRLAVIGWLGALLLAAVAAGVAGPALGTNPTPSFEPFVEGRHVYDDGGVLTADQATRVEQLARQIEAAGGGRVAFYAVAEGGLFPNTAAIASSWGVDGILITGFGGRSPFLTATIGATLRGRLDTTQLACLSANDKSAVTASISGWATRTLAMVDAFLGGRHVFDALGVLDAAGQQQAEAAMTNLGSQLGAAAYVAIVDGGNKPDMEAFFDSDLHRSLGTSLVIVLAIGDGQIAGRIESDNSLAARYEAGGPWSRSTISTRALQGGAQAVVLDAVNAVQKPPLISSDMVLFIEILAGTLVAVVVGGVLLSRFGSRMINRLAGTTGPIAGGVAATAVIESIAETGATVTTPSVGPKAPVYQLGLQVTRDGGAPYAAQVRAIVPRIFTPMIVPGAQVAVVVDPADSAKVSIDFAAFSRDAGPGASGAADAGHMGIRFDASGRPNSADVSTMAGAVISGSLPVIPGSADHLLMTGTHGTATITTAQPLGKRVRDVNPAADPSRLDDPLWMFTAEVSLPGQNPFPAVFGHRVPTAKVAQVAPGVRLAVAVDERDRNEEVAIDWDHSPLAV